MTKQVVKFGAAVMTTLLALMVLWQFSAVFVYVLISLALAAALRPFANRLVGQSIVVRVVWILVYLAALSSFGFLLFLAGKTALNEIQQLAQNASVQDVWNLPIWLQGSSFEQVLIARLPPPSKLFEAVTGEQGQHVLPVIFGFTQGIAETVSGVIIILLLSLYWSSSQVHFERLWLSLLASEQRKQARDIWHTIEPALGDYIRSEGIQSILAALLLGLGYWMFGSPYPTLLALIGALAWLVPVVGVALAVIAPLLLGLLTGVKFSLLMVLYTLLVLIALQSWVEPRLFKRRWDNPVMTLVILLVMADAFGLPGIIVAPPISVICQILWSLLVSHRLASGTATQVSDLKERQERLWDIIRSMDEQPLALVTSSMERLAQLIEKAEPILQTNFPAEPSIPNHSLQSGSAKGEPSL